MTPPTAALSCPFCAKPPEVEECDDGSTWVSCSDGSMKCPAYGNGAELPVWNTRAPAVQATADADELAREIVLSVDAASAAMKGPRFAFEELQKEIATIIRKAVSPKVAQEEYLSSEDRKRINRACWRMVSDCRFAELEYAQIGIRELPKGKTLTEVLTAWQEEGDAYFRLTKVFSAPAAVSGDKQEKERG